MAKEAQAGLGGRAASCQPGLAGGLILAGYGIWQMLIAKKHIDELCKLINYAKNELIKETKGEHHHRPGDNLIRQAFSGLTEMYFGQISHSWNDDL